MVLGNLSSISVGKHYTVAMSVTLSQDIPCPDMTLDLKPPTAKHTDPQTHSHIHSYIGEPCEAWQTMLGIVI